MKRRTKLFLLLTCLLCLLGISAILRKIQQNAASPFPGAVVVLDDASWKLRFNDGAPRYSFLWATPDTILYEKKTASGYQVVQQRIDVNTATSAPEILPLNLTQNQFVDSITPDGKTLCIYLAKSTMHYISHFVRIDKQEKPIVIKTKTDNPLWSPDSKFLYGIGSEGLVFFLERCDAKTGVVTKTVLNTAFPLELSCVTPESKLLCIHDTALVSSGSSQWEWQVTEIRGKNLVTTPYRKNFSSSAAQVSLAQWQADFMGTLGE